jgi:hypothetical protein
MIYLTRVDFLLRSKSRAQLCVAMEFQGPTVKRSAINLTAGIIIDEAFEKMITPPLQ